MMNTTAILAETTNLTFDDSAVLHSVTRHFVTAARWLTHILACPRLKLGSGWKQTRQRGVASGATALTDRVRCRASGFGLHALHAPTTDTPCPWVSGRPWLAARRCPEPLGTI